nr:HAMP domain-containing sensor histidine kinase [Ktedonobacteraceae bacterium]
MLEDTEFQRVAQQIGNLIGCDTAQLFLGCMEAGMRHPLLKTWGITAYRMMGSIGRLHDSGLLQNERIRALGDVAIQSGLLQSFDNWQHYTEDIHIQSIAIVPLERPAGVLGFLLLTDHHANAFYQGERLLLRCYLPPLAQKLEAALYRWRDDPSSMQSSERVAEGIALQSAAAVRVPKRALVSQEKEQLQRQALDRLKNEFISMVSHELRNPLTAIKGYAVLLQAYGIPAQSDESGSTVLGPQRQRQYLDSIMEQIKHLEILISDLLDISRLHAGRLLLRYRDVNVALLCQRVVQLIQKKYDQSSVQHYEITCVLPADLPMIWADPDRVQQVLTNLLDNAVKYSPYGGHIEVSATTQWAIRQQDGEEDLVAMIADGQNLLIQTPDEVCITVRDNGIGIAQEQQQHLFQPFRRLEHALTNEIPGVGLGLYITRKLVEAMEGSIILDSCEGEGTSVTITLPCGARDAKASLSKAVVLTPM